MTRTPPSPSDRHALGFALVMLAVLGTTLLWFAAYAPATVPSHIGADGTIDGRTSKITVLVIVVLLSLLFSGGFAYRPLWDAVPLRSCPVPFVFNAPFWIAEGRSDFLRTQMLEYLRILSGLSSAFIASDLWMTWLQASGHAVPSLVPTLTFSAVVALFLVATVRHYLRLRPSEWAPGESAESD